MTASPEGGAPGVGGATVLRVADADAAARAAADAFTDAALGAAAERGRFTVALAGGATPRAMYRLLADPRAGYRGRIPWDRVHVFFGDERQVPPDHPESNFRMAREALLDHVRTASVHRLHGELVDAEAAAAGYQAELARAFGIAADGPPPALDLVLLGLGADGHTASLFPGSDALQERRRWVAAPFVERIGAHRLTLTLPTLERAREVLFLVTGLEKADAVSRVLTPGAGGPPPPAARVRSGRARWILDAAAASQLPRG